MRITEILIMAKEPIGPTRLMSRTNHSYEPFIVLVDRLLKLGLLELKPGVKYDGRSKVRYLTTERGKDVIENALSCYRLIEDDYEKELIKKIRVY